MNLVLKSLKGICFFLLLSLFFTNCSKDEATSPNPTTPPTTVETKGRVNLEITDAPSDDPNIKGVFVTVAEVKIDGKTFDGFKGKTTIELSAYHSGRTEALGLGELETGSYKELTIVLDYETDAQGNSPGCYALTKNDEKEKNNCTIGAVRYFIFVVRTRLRAILQTL